MSVSSPTPLVIAGNTISGNKQGLYILYSPDPESASDKIEVTLNNNSITANQQQLSGGGICFHNCEVTMDGDRINNNTADDYGGGLCAYASTITMRNCTFEGNKAKYGGALALRNGSSAEIKNTLFSSNTASDSGPVAHYSSNSSLELDATVTYGGGNSSSDIYQGY
ncbi:MAG: hypothetical protein GX050_04270 [Firmicutes bacterium]|nr:hypothetical protein [Bacillota bacterium]